MLHKFRLERMMESQSDALLNEAELERLADFYHSRGFYEEAIKTLEELLSIRYQREYEAVRHLRRRAS